MNSTLSRRQFLAAGALGGAGCLLGTRAWAAPAAAERFALNHVLASSMYGNLSLDTVLDEVAKAGMSSLDFWAKVHGTQHAEAEALPREELHERLRRHGVTVPFTTRYDLGPLQLAAEMEFVRSLGGRAIVTGARGPVGLTGSALKAAVGRFDEQLRPHLAQAGEHGLTLLIENHAASLIESPDSVLWLAEATAGEPLGIALAPHHLPQDARTLADLIRGLGDRLGLFYGWQHGVGGSKPMPKADELLQLPGRGSLDFAPLVRALRETKFRGWTEILMHPTPRGFPILPTAAEVTTEINRARDYLDGLVAATNPS